MLVACCGIGAIGSSCQAQAAVGEGVDDEAIEAKILAACAVARDAGVLVDAAVLAAQLTRNEPVSGKLPAVRTQPLTPPDLYAQVLPSTRIVGHYYKCRECEEWHFSGASGFCIDDHGAVATCAHVVAPDETMQQSYLVVADMAGAVWPVVQVAAAAIAPDLCILETPAKGTVPLPLRPAVRTGEAVWCLSHPDHQFAFFSAGIVARRYVLREPPVAPAPTAKPGEGAGARPVPDLARPALPWLHVTCDFAKGSSGAPIVDACGNVVAVAQSTTTVVYDETTTPIDTQMVFKTAAPAAALLTLRRDGAR